MKVFFFVLNSAKHETLTAHKYKNIQKFSFFRAQQSLECYFSCSLMLKCQQLIIYLFIYLFIYLLHNV